MVFVQYESRRRLRVGCGRKCPAKPGKIFQRIQKKDHFIKFNVDGLLRGDYQSRMNGYAIARQNGWMSANDIRELENLDKIPAEEGGDLYLVNGNMLPLNMAGAYADKESNKEGDTDDEVLELDKGNKRTRTRRESS